MDGRIQIPAIDYLQEFFKADYVDIISEAGPNAILANKTDPNLLQSIYNRVDISVGQHHSVGIALIGHHDCAGNPSSDSKQQQQIVNGVKCIQQAYAGSQVIGLWVDKTWTPNCLTHVSAKQQRKK